MTTLLAIRDPTGRPARCTAACYAAHEPECTCRACGGVNHGVGRARATANAQALAAAGGPAGVPVPKQPAEGGQRRLPGLEE